MHLIRTQAVTDELLSDVASRDCVLWVTIEKFECAADYEQLISLMNGPWRAVFLESSSADFASVLSAQSSSLDTPDSTGAFIHLIASDPVALVLPRRAKPVFFLNGRRDCTGAEGADLPSRAAQRRRLNMTARLRDLEPRRILILGENPQPALDDLVDMWDVDFRSLLSIVTAPSYGEDELKENLKDIIGLRAVQWIAQKSESFAKELTELLQKLVSSNGILVSAKVPGGIFIEIDLNVAELPEQPISDLCEFISLHDTLPVSPDDLRDEEFRHFFTRGADSWRAYAAGLPWLPDPNPERQFLETLGDQLTGPPGSIEVVSIISDPGAGGSTQARALAFSAAKEGFPVLLLKQEAEIPNALELTGFLFRASAEVSRRATSEVGGEPVWVIVLDVQHASRGDELERLCAELVRSGRKVTILKVTPARSPLDLPSSIPHQELVHVRHEIDSEDVGNLGRHLNAFLRRYGKEKTLQEWMSFWTRHRPEMETGIASFWIALEFWLAGFLEMGESIQTWVLKQFKELDENVEVQRAVLEIASLSIERCATPERLLNTLKSTKLPWATALDNVRSSTPGIGLIEGESFPYGRVWAIAHDILARYLINGVWNDRLLCEKLQLPLYEDSVALRLAMIAELSKRAAMGEAFARQFAVSLATSILKLDEQQRNAEFFKHWRKVLEILEAVPQAVRMGSRTFNHHLAITRRRITYGDLFQLDDLEKKNLLEKAAVEVDFALKQIESSVDDESDLNLLNTLALIYQDLAELARKNGDREELSKLLAKSDEITRQALKADSNSPYVLETAAKNLLRQGLASDDPSERVESASKALSFVFQALQLDGAYNRRMKLGQLAEQALKALSDNNATNAINSLCSQGSPYGYIAKAWISLSTDDQAEFSLLLDSVEPEPAAVALEILNESPERDWLLVRLMYDLTIIAKPNDFQSQLRLLDELAGTKGYQLSLQQALERAVLLFISGQHKAAVEEFKWLRPRVKESHAVIFVPQRLRWLLTPDGLKRAVCTATVVDGSASARGMAKVKELGGAWAPYNPQEFDKPRMAPNEQFKCLVTFAAMGPFLKPTDSGHKHGGVRG